MDYSSQKETDDLLYKGTGSNILLERQKSIKYVIGQYEVTVIFTEDGEFIGIEEIALNKSFIDYEIKKRTDSNLNVDKYYEED